MRNRTLSLGTSCTVALLLALPLAAFAGTVRLGTHLKPTEYEPDASGAALFERHPGHKDPVLRLRVAVAGVASTDLVAVLVNGEFLDLIELSHAGGGHLDLSTAHGHDVPELQEGDIIQIVNAYDGETLLLEGTLGALHHP